MVARRAQAVRESSAAIQDPRGADRPPALLPQLNRGQAGGSLRSSGKAKPICVWRCLFPIVRTTERKPAGTSVLRVRRSRYAAREEINDRRLRLTVTVEPVIGNHSAGEDDAHPKDERKDACCLRRPGRDPVE